MVIEVNAAVDSNTDYRTDAFALTAEIPGRRVRTTADEYTQALLGFSLFVGK